MATKKIVVNGQTKMDLTDTTATVTDVAKGKVFYGANGERCIGSATGSGGGLVEKDINFFDYDGTLLYSYTLEEAQSLTQLPEGPNHEDMGLWFGEWNWTLAEIKSEKAFADVGASFLTYDPSDPNANQNITKVYVDGTLAGRNDINLYFSVHWLDNQNDYPVTIDWGDGTQVTKTAKSYMWISESHEYEDFGKYVISIDIPQNRDVQFGSTSTGTSCLDGSAYGIACGNSVSNLAAQNDFLGMEGSFPLQFLTFSHGIGVTETIMEAAPCKFLAIPRDSSVPDYAIWPDTGIQILSLPGNHTMPLSCLLPCGQIMKRWIFSKDTVAIDQVGDYYANVYTIEKLNLTHCPRVVTLSDSPYCFQYKGIGANHLTIYVPKALENDYKTATNWLVISHLIKGV